MIPKNCLVVLGLKLNLNISATHKSQYIYVKRDFCFSSKAIVDIVCFVV